MNGLPVTIRTVDIGADKPLDRMAIHELRHEHALNPALGLRAIRSSLSEPDMFRQQLRAILRASAFGKVRILVPMVAHRSEILATMDALRARASSCADSGVPFGDVDVGAMIEVPAAALTMPLLLQHFDFVSIGTNDLIQYTLAIDRADEAVAHLYDPWHPAVLRLIADVITAANAAGKRCERVRRNGRRHRFHRTAARPGAAAAVMHPSQISAVKQRVLRADTARLAQVSMARAGEPTSRSGLDSAARQVDATPRAA